MRAFFQRHLDPVDRLGEVVFGLIMALCVIGACRIELEEPDNRVLLASVLGCNIAWGIVDGVMFVFSSLFERGLRARLVRRIKGTNNQDEAISHVAREFDERLEPLTSPEERRRIYLGIIELAKRIPATHVSVKPADILGGVAVALLIVVATIPVVLPYLLMSDPVKAMWASSAIAVSMLFMVGCWWGHMVGASTWRVGFGLTFFGTLLVILTVALGG